jgi:hypothetical protein
MTRGETPEKKKDNVVPHTKKSNRVINLSHVVGLFLGPGSILEEKVAELGGGKRDNNG